MQRYKEDLGVDKQSSAFSWVRARDSGSRPLAPHHRACGAGRMPVLGRGTQGGTPPASWHGGTGRRQLQRALRPPRASGTPLPHAAQESHPAELREMEEGRRDHSKGAEKKKLSVKPELGPSCRWHSSSEESSDRKTA